MENNYAKIEKISNEGYDLEFGTVLEDAFSNYKKIAGIGGIAMLLVCLVLGIFAVVLVGAIYGFTGMASSFTALNPEFMSGSGLLVMLIVTVIVAGIMSPINAGLIKMAYLARHNKDFGMGTVFEYFKSPQFKELFIAAAILAFIGNGTNYLLNFLGIYAWGALLTYVIAFFTFLTIPLIIFANLNATQAISMSIKLVLKQPFILLGLLIVAIIFAALGIIGFCIGIFFTLPFLYSMYFTIYAAIIPSGEKDVLDEIGRHEE